MMETPPLARGRPDAKGCTCFPSGNTPACAGKTVRISRAGDVYRKHPRLRGEDSALGRRTSRRPETPPLARGRPRSKRATRCLRGNTPACAGKTSPLKYAVTESWKHPRLRGEDPPDRAAKDTRRETPPLARGRPKGAQSYDETTRNTPACAGKT